MLRNLTSRKLRVSLTITGIMVGIWALVVMGAMANKLNVLVDGGSAYFQDKIMVSDATNAAFSFGITPMPIDVAEEIRAVPGVAVAVPRVQFLLDPDFSGNAFQAPDFVVGFTAGSDRGYETFLTKIAEGRFTTPEDAGKRVVVLGADLSRKFGKGVGDTLEIRGAEFEVIGVREPTLMFFDTTAVIPLEAAQSLLAEEAPLLTRMGYDPEQASRLASLVMVYPEAGADIPSLAQAIEAQVEQVQAISGAEFDEQFGSTVAIFNAVILSVALISLVVGGLSVINTMTMSVAERTREIGIKRAIGASQGRIMRELLLEAALMGLIGGALGLALGVVFVHFGNRIGQPSGIILFLLTPQTALFAVTFSTVIGAIAGAAPAWKAARLDPIEALRYE